MFIEKNKIVISEINKYNWVKTYIYVPKYYYIYKYRNILKMSKSTLFFF